MELGFKISLSAACSGASVSGPATDPYALTGWWLQLPVDADGLKVGLADTVTATGLIGGYTDAWFARANDEFAFVVESDGATTTGSIYPRCELCEEIEWAWDDASELNVIGRTNVGDGLRTIVLQSLDGDGAAFQIEIAGASPNTTAGLLQLKYDGAEGGAETVVILRSDVAFDAAGISETISVRIRRYVDKLEVFHGGNMNGVTPDFTTVGSAVEFSRTDQSGDYYWKKGNYYQSNIGTTTCTVWHTVGNDAASVAISPASVWTVDTSVFTMDFSTITTDGSQP